MSDVVCVCGRVSLSDDRFCASCGRPLSAPSPGQQPAAVDGVAEAEREMIARLRGLVGAQVADRVAAQGSQPFEERRVVTALFADVSGFTALAGRLDTEELLGVLDPVIAGLTSIVSRYDGHVEKFAGDALLALFGAPVAHEDDAARALAVALDMQAELAGLSVHGEAHGLRLHVGVSTGSVVARAVGSAARMDYAVLGEALILAQRFESVAPAGEIYVGALTRQLAGPEFTFEDMGALSVRGRADPVPAFRLLGRRPEGRWSEGGLLVGRQPERAALSGALASVRSGGSASVRLWGPAGSGKSRLVGELRREAAAAGLVVVELVGASHAQSPYRCLLPLVRAALASRYRDQAGEPDLLRLVEDDATRPVPATLTAVLLGRAGAADDLGDRAPDAVRRELAAGGLAWLVDLAGRGPVAVVADGLQWFDPASIEVLAQAAAAATPGVLLCLSGREEPRVDLVPGPTATDVVVRLGPLGREAVRDLVAGDLALVPDDRLLDHLEARGQGNPLMIRETVRQLQSDGLLDVQHGHVRLTAGTGTQSVPASLEALLAARLDALPQPSVRVATTAAVIGFVVPLDLLCAVTGLSASGLGPHLADLVGAQLLQLEVDPAGVVVRDEGVLTQARFGSTLVRDTLYARLTTRRRREVHGRVADVLGNPEDPTEEVVALLAEHRFLAGDLAAALPWLRRAAAHARRLFAQDSAAHTLGRAVEAARRVAPDQLADLLTDLAEVRAERGELDRALDLYTEARLVGNDARAWAGAAAVLRRQGHYDAALALLDESVRAEPAGDRRLVAYERGWTLSVSGDLQGCLAASRAGLALGDPDDRGAGLLLLQVVRAQTLLGDLVAARANADRAIANLGRAGDAIGLCTAFRLLGSLQQSAGDLDAAAATLEEGLAMARRTGLVEEVGGCQINLGLVHADRGDHRAAEQSYRAAATTFEQAGLEAGRAIAYGNRSCELLALGELDQARDLALRALELAERIGNHLTAADIHQTLALVAEATGDQESARREAVAAVAGFDRAGMPAAAEASRELVARLGPGEQGVTESGAAE